MSAAATGRLFPAGGEAGYRRPEGGELRNQWLRSRDFRECYRRIFDSPRAHFLGLFSAVTSAVFIMTSPFYRILQVSVGAAALILASIVVGCGGSGEASDGGMGEQARMVSAVTAEATTVVRYLDAIGEATARRTVHLKPQVSGRLVGIHFEEGRAVAEGDLLFTLDAAPFEAVLRQARGELAALRAAEELAALEEARSRSLREDNLISLQQQQALSARVAELRGQVEAAEGRLASATVNFEYTQIRAPFSGVAGFHGVQVGAVVEPGMSGQLTTLRQVDPIYIDFSVNAAQLPDVRAVWERLGRQVPLSVRRTTAGDEGSVVGSAQLTTLGSAVDRVTGTVDLRGEMANPDGAIWPQEPLRLRLELEELPGTVVLPIGCVQLSQQGPFVMVINDIAARATPFGPAKFGVVEPRPVTVGQRQPGGRVAILSGLQGGESVVLDGQIFLFPGMPVQIAEGRVSAQ